MGLGGNQLTHVLLLTLVVLCVFSTGEGCIETKFKIFISELFFGYVLNTSVVHTLWDEGVGELESSVRCMDVWT